MLHFQESFWKPPPSSAPSPSQAVGFYPFGDGVGVGWSPAGCLNASSGARHPSWWISLTGYTWAVQFRDPCLTPNPSNPTPQPLLVLSSSLRAMLWVWTVLQSHHSTRGCPGRELMPRPLPAPSPQTPGCLIYPESPPAFHPSAASPPRGSRTSLGIGLIIGAAGWPRSSPQAAGFDSCSISKMPPPFCFAAPQDFLLGTKNPFSSFLRCPGTPQLRARTPPSLETSPGTAGGGEGRRAGAPARRTGGRYPVAAQAPQLIFPH